MGGVVYVRGDRHILWQLVYPQLDVDTLVGSDHANRGRLIYRLVDPSDRFNRTTTITLQMVQLARRIYSTGQIVNSEPHS